MKLTHSMLLSAAALGASAVLALAQDNNPPQGGPGGPGGPGAGGPGGPGGRRPMNPIVQALDADRARVIDAAEIEYAPEALKKLDKNNDGKLEMDEIRPQRPAGGPGGLGGGRGGAGGPGGPGEATKQ